MRKHSKNTVKILVSVMSIVLLFACQAAQLPDDQGTLKKDPEVLLTDPIQPDDSKAYLKFYSDPTIIKNDIRITNADEAVDKTIVAIGADRDGHSDHGFEPLFPPIGIAPSCNVESHRLTVWPVQGNESRDWTINNYRDLAPGPLLRDYLVTGPQAKTYDTHRGIDIDTPSFREMDADTSLILAAAPGVVEEIEETFPDRNIEWLADCKDQNNYIKVRHPQGFLMGYSHLKTNSVTDTAGLSLGDTVEAGDVLGVVGSAGCSTQAHVHFQVNDCDGNVVDPFQQNMWVSPQQYDAPLGFMDAVIKQNIPSGNAFGPLMKDPGPDDQAVLPNQLFNIGLMMGGGQPGDTYEFEIFDPSGDEVADAIFQSTLTNVRQRSWWRWLVMTYDEPGEWRFRILVNNVIVQGSRRLICVSKYANETGFKIVRFGIPDNLYQYESDHAVCGGYRPQFVDAYNVNGKVHFNAYWDKGPGQWIAKHGLNGQEYDDFVDEQVPLGFRIKSVDSYEDGGMIKYAVIMEKLSHPGQVAKHRQTPSEYQVHFDIMENAGRVPVIVSVAYANGQRFITSVFETNTMGSFFSKSLMTSNEFQANFDDQNDNKGRSLLYTNAYNTPGESPRFSGVWVANPPFNGYVTNHNQSGNQFQNNFNTFTGLGNTTSIISGYEKNNQQRFAGHWIR